jgi:hypothetical protein
VLLSWVPSHSALAALRGRESALSDLPGAVVKVGVPRGPGAVEGERELLVVLVLLTPHPERLEHFSAEALPYQRLSRCSKSGISVDEAQHQTGSRKPNGDTALKADHD